MNSINNFPKKIKRKKERNVRETAREREGQGRQARKSQRKMETKLLFGWSVFFFRLAGGIFGGCRVGGCSTIKRRAKMA